VTHGNYTELGLSLDGGIPRDAALDPSHERWHGRTLAELAAEKKQNRADMLICGTDKFDRIVRDPQMKAIHTELAGGQCMLSNNYYIEKHGPCHGGGLHHGGFPKMRTFHYGYDHTTSKFDCYSTKATIILSDMSTIEKGPFACIPGNHSRCQHPAHLLAALGVPAASVCLPPCPLTILAVRARRVAQEQPGCSDASGHVRCVDVPARRARLRGGRRRRYRERRPCLRLDRTGNALRPAVCVRLHLAAPHRADSFVGVLPWVTAQFTEGITHNAYPVLDDSRRRSLFFNWIPAVDRDNLPHMRMSIYPEHVLERLADEEDQLTAPGYI
jgi:hypothetical protein